jgi:hypothetical protein
MNGQLRFGFLWCVCGILSSSIGFGQQIELPAKEHFHLYLLAGQSNMAGRGKVEESDTVANPRVLALTKDGSWAPATAPLHWDKSVAGTGLGRSFALTLVESDPDIVIGLIPAACGGSAISSWVPGGYHDQTKSHPWDDAVQRTQRAMQDGTLKGILWHQGESDSQPERSAVYQKRLTELILRFRNEFQNPQLPFLIGQLGQFPERPWSEARQQVDAAHRAVATSVPFVSFVHSDDLTCNPDNVHFDSKSLRTFGKRYAAALQRLQTTTGNED